MQREPHIDIVPLDASHLPSLIRLKDQIGWNQSTEDLRRFLKMSAGGCFVALHQGHVVGSITTINYGRELAWIGMMIVDPAHRRQGIAKKLMVHTLAYLESRGVEAIKLDATPEGYPLYLSLGFTPELTLERWEAEAPAGEADSFIKLETGHLATVLELDKKAFGTNRAPLLTSLLENSPVAPLLSISPDGLLQGYVFARPGSRAFYIGPLVATSGQVARQLLGAMLSTLRGHKVYCDFHFSVDFNAGLAEKMGFAKQRDLIRMCYRKSSALGTSGLVFAIAGPELG